MTDVQPMTLQPLAVRPHPLKQYLIALLATAAAYVCYLLVINPFIDGQLSQVQEANQIPAGPPLPVDDKTEFAKYLPAGSWELKPCKSLDTAEGKILFQDYSRNDADGTWDVYPFTMILKPRQAKPGEAAGPPLILRTEKKAKLRFRHGLQLGNSVTDEPNKLEQAQLIGQVEVYQPGSDRNPKIQITTSNVQVTRRKIFTVSPVDFQFGDHQGRGRNLSIELSHESINSNLNADFSNIKGIRRLQLAYLDFLRLQPETKPPSNTKRTKTLQPENSPLEITCDGAFQFDFLRNQAAFRENVVVKQLDPQGDNLVCEKLDLYFNDLAENPVAPRENELLDAKFELKEIVAAGSPAVLSAKSRDSRVQGEYLRYDLVENLVEARGAVEQVEIVQGPNQFVSQHFHYEIPSDNSLGKLNAFGPGWMVRQGETVTEAMQARWKNHLTIRQIDPHKKVITLDGDGYIQLDPKTAIDAQTIRFALWENQKQSPAGETAGWDYQPARLVATGQVQVRSKDIQGSTERLTAHWPNNPVPLPQPGTQSSQPATSQVIPFLPAKNVIRSYPATAVANTRPQVVRRASYPDDQRPSRPSLFFEGQELALVLRDEKGETNITDLEMTGDVKVWQLKAQGSAQQAAREIELAGHRLKAEPQGNKNYRLQISEGEGTTAATVTTEEMTLIGPDIYLDQQANRVWINGGGELMMNLADANKKPLPPQATRKEKQNLKITWQGGMIFDGSQIYFERNVISHSITRGKENSQRQTSTESTILNIELDRYVSLRTPDAADQGATPAQRPEPKVKTLLLVDRLPEGQPVFQLASFQQASTNRPVLIASITRDAAGAIMEQQKLVAPTARIHVNENRLTAEGPGALAIHRPNRSSDNATPLSFQKKAKTTAPYLFIQTNFDQALRVDTESKSLDMTGNVRALYIPVSSMDQSYSPDDPNPPADAFRLNCATLTMHQWTPQATGLQQSELRARGNARVSNSQFTATAHEVRYDQGNDYLYLEGSSRSDATLQTISETGGKSARLVAEKIRYRPSDNSTKIENMKRATMRNR
ncbi:MAG: hypothetical protein VYE64_12655 [Planctomycetota bacterium]|nr:hypothetical protein [Planctomycetota bacterium]